MNRQLFNAMAAQYATPEVSGDGVVSWEAGKKCVIPSVKLYGAAVQDGTPTPDAPVMPVCNNGVFAARGRNLLKDSAVSYNGNTKDGYTLSGWAATFVNNADLIAMLEPDTQYTVRYKFRLDSLHEGTTAHNQNNHGMLVLYSGSGLPGHSTVSFYDLSLDTVAEANTWQVGSTIERARTFITPAALHDPAANYRIIAYTRRSVDGTNLVALESGTFLNIQIEKGNTASPYTPYHDGGQAQAPELWAIPGTEYRDEWNPQTGWGVRRIAKVEMDGVSIGKRLTGTDGYISGERAYAYIMPDRDISVGGICSHFRCYYGSNLNDLILPRLSFSALNQSVSLSVAHDVSGVVSTDSRATIISKINSYVASVVETSGKPVTVWYALATPEPFYSPPSKLTQPTGYGQIIQVSGDVPDCPITAKYLTHS